MIDPGPLFWSKVDKAGPPSARGPCWLWLGAKDEGYGIFRLGARIMKAHRLAYLASGRSIPRGLVIDHLCRNRSCVNPSHMQPVTIAENLRRGRAARSRLFPRN